MSRKGFSMAHGFSVHATNRDYPPPYPFLRRSISNHSAPPYTGQKRNIYGFEKLSTEQQRLKQDLLEKEQENELFYQIIQKLNKDIAKWKIKFDYQKEQNTRLEKEVCHLRRTFAPSQHSTEIDELKQQLKEWKTYAARSSQEWQAEVKKLQREITILNKQILGLLNQIKMMKIAKLKDQMNWIISAPAQARQNTAHFQALSRARHHVLSLL